MPANSIPTIHSFADAHAAVLFRMQRHAEARAELLASIERNGEQVNDLCNLANATVCLGLQEEAVEWPAAPSRLRPMRCCRGALLCNTLPYRDGITGAELLAALEDCSDRLPREACPRSPTRAIPTVRS